MGYTATLSALVTALRNPEMYPLALLGSLGRNGIVFKCLRMKKRKNYEKSLIGSCPLLE
jgi:hypothetical protein